MNLTRIFGIIFVIIVAPTFLYFRLKKHIRLLEPHTCWYQDLFIMGDLAFISMNAGGILCTFVFLPFLKPFMPFILVGASFVGISGGLLLFYAAFCCR